MKRYFAVIEAGDGTTPDGLQADMNDILDREGVPAWVSVYSFTEELMSAMLLEERYDKAVENGADRLDLGRVMFAITDGRSGFPAGYFHGKMIKALHYNAHRMKEPLRHVIPDLVKAWEALQNVYPVPDPVKAHTALLEGFLHADKDNLAILAEHFPIHHRYVVRYWRTGKEFVLDIVPQIVAEHEAWVESRAREKDSA
jgi:hypothetical protein